MDNDDAISKKGFCGESIPFGSGLTVAVKSHGHSTGPGSYENVLTDDQLNIYDHLKEFRGVFILLVRNPFRAIEGHRNLDEGGHVGLADDSYFEGNYWDKFVERALGEPLLRLAHTWFQHHGCTLREPQRKSREFDQANFIIPEFQSRQKLFEMRFETPNRTLLTQRL